MTQPRENLTKQIFVAYAYTLYDQRDYRKVYSALEKAFGVKFIFADEKITNMHILQKIISYIRGSDFSLFDISAWNPNVTLELGIALATSDDWYICFNPEKTDPHRDRLAWRRPQDQKHRSDVPPEYQTQN